jgi:hypothetical protein
MPCILHKCKNFEEKQEDTLQNFPFEKMEECDSEKVKHRKRDNDKRQTPEFVLLLQKIQPPARQMQNPNSRQPTLHG